MVNIILFKSAACIDMFNLFLSVTLCCVFFVCFVFLFFCSQCLSGRFFEKNLVFLLLYSANTMLVGKLLLYFSLFWTGL